MIVYLHIAKTGGTTMLHYLDRQGKTAHVTSWWASSWDIPKDTEILFSHCPYGEPDKHFPGEHQYITFLRDPVDRIISNYYHVVNNFRHPKYSAYSSRSLKDLVRANLFSTFDNGIIRLISGRQDIGDLMPEVEVAASDLEQAKKNLATFTAVGFLDTFNHDLVRFAKIFGWTDLRYNRYRTGQRPSISQLQTDVVDAIKEQNKFDIEFVEFAREIFQ